MDQENPYEPSSVIPDSSLASELPHENPTVATLLFSFGGRIPRRVYWGVSLTTMISFYTFAYALVSIFGDAPIANAAVIILYVPTIWISLAVQAKRWHDRNKSGWWILINFIPVIGGLWSFIELGCLRGTVGPNRYGRDPT